MMAEVIQCCHRLQASKMGELSETCGKNTCTDQHKLQQMFPLNDLRKWISQSPRDRVTWSLHGFSITALEILFNFRQV